MYDPETRELRDVAYPASHGRYLPSGHLLYAWEGELLAVPFDLEPLLQMWPEATWLSDSPTS